MVLDTWHHFRGAAGNDLIRAIRADRVVAIQFSDGESQRVGADLEDTFKRRRLPGEGDFDLRSFLTIVTGMGVTAPVGVEVLSDELRKLGPQEPARRAADATRQVLAAAGQPTWPGALPVVPAPEYCAEAPILVLAGTRRNGQRGAVETWCGRGLMEAVDSDERAPGHRVRVVQGLGERQHRGHARVGTIEGLGPLIPGARRDRAADRLPQPGPRRAVVLIAEVGRRPEAEPLQQFREELPLDGGHGHVPAVRAGVRVVERRSSVEQVGVPLLAPGPGAAYGPDLLREHPDTVDHGDVNHLAAA